MKTRQPPGAEIYLSKFPSDATKRHEAFVDLFGQYIFWMRNWAIDRSRERIEDNEVYDRVGQIQRERYEGVASMKPKEREAALAFAEATVDEFCDLLLRFLGNEGDDLRIASGEAVQVLLEMRLIDVASENVVETEVINRGGKAMPKYWGQWLNRHKGK